MRSRRIFAAALTCCSLLAAGCGGGSSLPSAGDVGAAAVGSTTTIDPVAANALGQQALLTLADMPAGWTQSAETSDDDLRFPGADCADYDVNFNGPLAGADADFEGPDVFGTISAVGHTVAVTDAVTAAWARGAFADPRAVGCLRAAIDQSFTDDGLEGVEVRVEHPTLNPAESPNDLVAYVTFALADGTPFSYRLQFTITVVGNAVSLLSVLSSPLSPVDATAIAAAAAHRLNTAGPVPAPTTTAAPQDVRAAAQPALLTLADVPADWSDPGPAFRTARFPGAGCDKFENALNGPSDGVQVNLDGPEALGARSTLSHVVALTVPRTAAAAEASFSDPLAKGCLTSALEKQFAAIGVESITVKFEAVPQPTPGAHDLVASVTISLPDGTPFTYTAWFSVAVAGNAVSFLTVISAPTTPVDAAAIAVAAAQRITTIH